MFGGGGGEQEWWGEGYRVCVCVYRVCMCLLCVCVCVSVCGYRVCVYGVCVCMCLSCVYDMFVSLCVYRVCVCVCMVMTDCVYMRGLRTLKSIQFGSYEPVHASRLGWVHDFEPAQWELGGGGGGVDITDIITHHM